MKRYLIAVCFIPLTSFSAQYAPKGAVHIPEKSCTFHLSYAASLYRVPNMGFMIKTQKNRWRKVQNCDKGSIDMDSKALHSFIKNNEGRFVIYKDNKGILSMNSYPNQNNLDFLAQSMLEIQKLQQMHLKETLKTINRITKEIHEELDNAS